MAGWLDWMAGLAAWLGCAGWLGWLAGLGWAGWLAGLGWLGWGPRILKTVGNGC